MTLTHICLVTKNVKQLADFYHKILEIEPKFYGEDYAEISFESVILSIYSQNAQEELAPNTVPEISNKSVMLEFHVDNIEKEYERLQNLEITFEKPITTQAWGNKSFYFRDPDNNLLNFYQKIK